MNIVLIPMELQLVLILVTGLIIGTPLNVGGFSEITYIFRTIKNEMVLVNQNDFSENDVKELKSLLDQNLKEETL